MAETITEDGEIIESVALPAMIDTTMATALSRAEIDTQISTARTYPRSIKSAIGNIMSLATLDEDTAVENVYALKRGNKAIRGPSIRLAEIIASQWGNCRDGAQVIAIDKVNKVVVAEGFFHDLETNRATKATVQRRIVDSKGRLYSDDMIIMTGNAACSIAKRNAILAGVPKGVWRKALEECERVIKGDVKTLVERREAAIKAFAHFGLSADQVFTIMEVKGAEDIDLDDLVTLRGMFASLKNGETTVEELLRGTKAVPNHKVLDNPLADDPPAEKKDAKPDPNNAQDATKPAPKNGILIVADEDVGEGDKLRGHASIAGAADFIVTESGRFLKSKIAEGEELPDEVRVNVAKAMGRFARAKGQTRKTMPGAFRDTDHKAEADAWLAGYDDPGEPPHQGSGGRK